MQVFSRRRCSGAYHAVGAFALALALPVLQLGVVLLSGCKSERAASLALVTQVQMIRPAADRAALDPQPAAVPAAHDPELEGDGIDETSVYCREVEEQARTTNESLPQKLDRDTRATRIAAYGCDVVLEYAMIDLRVSDVAIDGVRAMRGEVLDKLCADRGARGVMDHGGSFTNVYRDDRSALIDQFTISAEDCTGRPVPAVPPSAADL